jgi:hypothetical protein
LKWNEDGIWDVVYGRKGYCEYGVVGIGVDPPISSLLDVA